MPTGQMLMWLAFIFGSELITGQKQLLLVIHIHGLMWNNSGEVECIIRM